MMNKIKTVLLKAGLLGVILAMISGCGNHIEKSNEDFSITDFPRDSQGYPDSHAVIINGSEYSLKDLSGAHTENNVDQEIELQDLKEGDQIEVILPQYLPGFLWSIEEKEAIDFTDYEKKELPVQQAVEGKSDIVQKFTFTVAGDTSILFKWSNVNECGKSFVDKAEEYILKISLSKSEEQR